MSFTRRAFVGGAIAAPFVASLPRAARAAGSVLRVIPHADLKNIDPIWTTAYITRNHGYMVFDTLFAMDETLTPRPQMVDTWTVSDDKLTWTFTLRDGLAWHDGPPVTAEDCVASLKRWGKRDGMGQKLMQYTKSLEAVDAKTFVLVLEKPFGLVLDAIGKISSNVPFMMPKRLAETDPFKQVPEIVGSGPFKFVKEEWVPGSKVVYAKNEAYVPRKEPVSAASGGKVAKVDRVEWLYIPDPTTAMNALMSGEVDYYEQVPGDLAPLIGQTPGITVEVLDPLGSQGMLRFNHLLKPFDKAEIRRAVIAAVNQEKFLQAGVGNPEFYKLCESYFPCGSPLENDAGFDLIQPKSIEHGKKLLAEGGYDGTKVVLMQPTDIPITSAFSLVAAETMRALGMEVEIQAMDWSTLTSRRAKKDPVDQGGWNVFHTWWIGGDLANPVAAGALSGGGPEKAWFGWPTDDKMEELRDKFAFTSDPAAQKELAKQIQKRAIEIGTHANVGTFFVPCGYRENVKGMIKSPVQFFWNMSV